MLNLEVREEKKGWNNNKREIVQNLDPDAICSNGLAAYTSSEIFFSSYTHIYTTDNVLKAKKHFANVHSRPRKSITMEPHIAIQTTQLGTVHLCHFVKCSPKQVSSKLTNFDMPDAIQWLLRVYCNLYIFVKTASATSAFFPPNMFLPCPVCLHFPRHPPHIYAHSLEAGFHERYFLEIKFHSCAN